MTVKQMNGQPERPNLRSRRLVVVFRAKENLLALTIFKKKGFRFPVGSVIQRLNFFSSKRMK